jgi:enoyl-CoA hydratase/carnithine racemase
MMREIGAALERLGAGRGLRALVLRGAGGAFCAGGESGVGVAARRSPTLSPA